jgi:peptide/nickel transport system substrate-binding protein
VPVDDPLPPGELLGGRYVIGPQVGRSGGQGTVYRALDEETGRYVAVKVIRPHLYRTDPALVDAETGLLASTRSAHVVALLDTVEVPAAFGRAPTRALVMELADSTLEDHIEDGVGAPASVVRTALAETLAGLADLHAANVTHNDVKPSNILRVDGRWKLADFGIATSLEGTHDYHAWQDASYAPPERTARGEVRAEGDLWSFGLTAYRALTGQPGRPSRAQLRALEAPWRRIVAGCLMDQPSQRLTLAELQWRLPRTGGPETLPRSDTRERLAVPGRAVTDRMRSRRPAGVAAAILVAVALIGAVVRWDRPRFGAAPPAGAVGGAGAGGRLIAALVGEPDGLDPTRVVWDAGAFQVANAVYDPLTAVDPQGQVRPYLLESFSEADEHRTWLLRLRPGVVFSNGDPLDAAALVTFLDAMRKSDLLGRADAMVSAVEAVDPLTVRVRMTRPWAQYPAHLAGQHGYVVAPRQLRSRYSHLDPIGTGPFKLDRWDREDRILLSRNPRHWRAGLPRLDALELVQVPSAVSTVDSVREGRFDEAPLNPQDLRLLPGGGPPTGPPQPGTTLAPDLTFVFDRRPATTTAIVFGTAREPFDDLRVRQAIVAATDPTALAGSTGWSPARVARGPLTPGTPFAAEAGYPGFDAARARQQLDAYVAAQRFPPRPGEPKLKIKLSGNEHDRLLLWQIAEQWRPFGIDATVETPTASIVRIGAELGDSGAFLVRVPADDPDDLWPLLSAETVRDRDTSLNLSHLRDDELTAALNDGRATAAVEDRRAAYRRMQERLTATLPFVWLYHDERGVAVGPRVRDADAGTFPDGSPLPPFVNGGHRFTEVRVS